VRETAPVLTVVADDKGRVEVLADWLCAVNEVVTQKARAQIDASFLMD
jgi:hypothetical protein